MGKINVLSTEISNKIAAGEVVERPASVVKELVENSIDAGADVITVEIKNGGISLIRVTDNGSGIAREDAATAFLRHATSKISTSEDLEAIYTLGFRGEALSSIGAVSNVNLYTKRTEDPVGVLVSCHGGEISPCEDTGCPAGTTVEVRDLFFNTPARMKFLKRDQTEASYVSDLMVRYILAHPEISFKFISNGKQQYFSAGDNSLKNAIYTVYGKDYANAMVEVDYKIGNLHIYGVAGKGGIARPNRNFQSFFVNKRYIKSALLIKATEEAYKNQIMIGKFPVCALNIEVNPAKIDINVHPTKLEVKFSEEKAIYELVYYGVKNALYTPPAVEREIVPEKKTQQTVFTPQKGEQIDDLVKLIKNQDYTSRFNPFEKKEEPKKEVKKEQGISQFKKKDEDEKNTVKEPIFFETKPEYNVPMPSEMPEPKKFSDLDKKEDKPVKEPIKEAEKPIEEAVVSEPKPVEGVADTEKAVKKEKVKISGQVFDTYIIASQGDKMLIIDQHAAHERLKFEELKAAVENDGVFSQMILDPVVITLSPEELDAYSDNEEIFEKLGFETEIFGKRQIIVRSAPSDLEVSDCEELILELLTELMNNKRDIISKKQERFMYTVACKAAIKANMTLSCDEMQKLVENVLELDGINTCPHGRPIVMTMTKYELEKQFKRIQ